MSKIFIDTNILAYTVDNGDKSRQKQSREMMRYLDANHDGVISTQILQEFYVVTTKKLGLDPVIAKKILQNFENLEIVQIDFPLIIEATELSVNSKISFWDALIISAAKSANCEFLWTEDLNPGQKFSSITIVNPFETFYSDQEIQDWLKEDKLLPHEKKWFKK